MMLVTKVEFLRRLSRLVERSRHINAVAGIDDRVALRKLEETWERLEEDLHDQIDDYMANRLKHQRERFEE